MDALAGFVYKEEFFETSVLHGGVLASTWVLTVEEHAGALEDLVKTSTL